MPASTVGPPYTLTRCARSLSITVDQTLQFQQNLSVFDVAVFVLIATSDTITDRRPLMPEVVANLTSAKRGEALLIR